MADVAAGLNPILRITSRRLLMLFPPISEMLKLLPVCLCFLIPPICIAVILGVMLVRLGHRAWVDWHDHRGLSFLQLGLRQLHRLLYQGQHLPQLEFLPRYNPPPAFASLSKRDQFDVRIEFSRVSVVLS